jgi:hypothetical protein
MTAMGENGTIGNLPEPKDMVRCCAGPIGVPLLLLLLLVARGLPAVPNLDEVVTAGEGMLYGITDREGLLYSDDGGRTWSSRSRGLPERVVYPFRGGEYRKLTSVAVNPFDPRRIAVTTDFGMYLSEDAGLTWEPVPLDDPVKTSNYLTAAALHPEDPDTLLIGTSFNGVFESRDRGLSWAPAAEMIGPLYLGGGFQEEVAAVRYVAEESNGPYLILVETGFERRYILSNGDRSEWRIVEGEPFQRAEDFVRTGEAETATDRDARLAVAGNKHGIYIRSHNASGETLAAHLDFIVEHGMNSIVVDMKDDTGLVTYDTNVEQAKTVGAVRVRFRLDELLEAAHARGVYVIGRIVVFKDEKLYGFADGKYAVWDGASDAPWGHQVYAGKDDEGNSRYEQREFWVDPFCEETWRYNLEIALELQERGIDEIQFDYIRFPTDGDLSRASYRFAREGMSRIDALESFLRMARDSIFIPISTDLYGFNSLYRMGNWNGQNIELFSRYVDVVCPMFYPSHFPRSFLYLEEYRAWAERLYRVGTTRANSIVDGRCIIRPYVQAFLIGTELEMEKPEYIDYLGKQLEGATAGGASGYTLWNNSNRYYMVTTSLARW